jgi:RNA polymerase sigma-70 factor (family 1)
LSSTSAYTDQELFLRVADNDETAFEMLFHRFVPKIQPVLMGMVQSEAVAQDLVQDIFLNIWTNRYKLPEIESPANWIFKIVYNRSYTWLEQQAVRQKAHQRIGAAQSPLHTNIPTEESVSFAETSRLVRQAIQALPPQTKKIYLLSREEGLKNQQIADTLHLSVNTVKNTLVNACKAIKEHLEKQGIHLPLVWLALHFL